MSAFKKPFLNIVVVDDNRRLPFHLYHYLSRSTGFGIGDISAPGGAADGNGTDGVASHCHRFWDKEKKPLPLRIPAVEAQVWWIDAEADVEELKDRLDRVLEKIQGTEWLFLVDVRGGESSARGYTPEGVESHLRRSASYSPEMLMLVSSYHTAPRWLDPEERSPRQIFSKTSTTFQKIEERIPGVRARRERGSGSSGAAASDSSKVLHILVTGAGLEFEDLSLGSSCAIGMPKTRKLLRKTFDKYGVGVRSSLEEAMFPLPEGKAFDEWQAPDLWAAAKDHDLDAYWDQLLTLEFQRQSVANDRVVAAEKEVELREHFRQRFLAHDWGHLPQTVDAAGLPWKVWLTTNYTRFADRAMAANGEPWEIVSTSNEARRLQRTLLHANVLGSSNLFEDRRHLFKLHGDIGHLTTMAIAGYDKKFSSPLSFPVDSLHEVYLAAFLFLDELVDHHLVAEQTDVVWHVLGHALQDMLLLDIMARVSRRHPGRHLFIVVDPQEKRKLHPSWRLKSALGTTDSETARSSARVHDQIPWVSTAREYLARLRTSGLLDRPLEDLKEALWIQD